MITLGRLNGSCVLCVECQTTTAYFVPTLPNQCVKIVRRNMSDAREKRRCKVCRRQIIKGGTWSNPRVCDNYCVTATNSVGIERKREEMRHNATSTEETVRVADEEDHKQQDPDFCT